MEETISRLHPLLLIAAYAVFWGWEGVAAARRTRTQRGRQMHNLAVSAICIALSAASGAGLLWLSLLAMRERWGVLQWVQAPFALSCMAGMVLLDLTDYARHRVSHSVPLLWRLHRVHHSDPAVDVTTSLRNHPIELLIRPVFLAVALIAFGIPPLSLLLQPLLQLPVLIFQHANIRLPPALDRALAWLIVTPGMHLVHHSRDRGETDTNYATLLSLWDRLFGTFHPAVEPAQIGIEIYTEPRNQTVLGMLATPFR